MIEIFKDISGYEGKYQISNYGRVKSMGRLIKKKLGAYGMSIEKIMIPAIKDDGYKTIYLRDGSSRKKFFIHRLVAIAFLANHENKPDVNHTEGNKMDNRSWKLEWTTKSENTKHAYRNHLKIPMRGELNGRVKLTEEKVVEIKQRYKTGNASYRILANEYDVDKALIARIIKGKAWPHVTLKTA